MPEDSQTLRRILSFKTIAVVGLSRDPQKTSHLVAAYLKARGYRIVPVNPLCEEVLGELCFPSLLRIPPEIASPIEVVDVFRKSEEVLPVLIEVIELQKRYHKVKAVWLQEGIVNNEAKEFAKKAGLLFVQDRCMKKEHEKLNAKKSKEKKAIYYKKNLKKLRKIFAFIHFTNRSSHGKNRNWGI